MIHSVMDYERIVNVDNSCFYLSLATCHLPATRHLPHSFHDYPPVFPPAILTAIRMTRQSAVKLFKALSYIGIYGGLLMPLMFIPIVIFPFVFSKLIFFQVLIGITFPAYIALAWMEPKYRPPRSLLYYAIIAYFLALALSTITSVDPLRSWWGNQERMNGLFTLLHLFAWLTMAVGLLKHWVDWKRLLNYEVALSVFMALVTILQKPFPKILIFEASERVGGLLDNPIYMGSYQIFNLSFIALLYLKTKHRVLRTFYLIAAVVDLVAFFLTQSRGAFFGLLAVIGTFALYYSLFTKSNKARLSILGAAAASFGLYVLAYIFRASAFVSSNPILNRLTNLQATTETRLIAWDIAWKGFLERPLTGWGFDAFHILFNLKYNPRSLEYSYYETWFDRAHNTVMDVLAMTGIFGFITYVSIFVVLILLVWKARKKGWIDLPIAAILTALPVGYFLQNLFVFDHPAAFSMSYLLFGLVIAATRPSFIGEKEETEVLEERRKRSEAKTRSAPWVAFTILQVIMLIIVWRYSVLPFKASMLSISANNYLRAGRLDEGFAFIRRAGKIPTPYVGEQAFLLSRDLIELKSRGSLQTYPEWQEVYAYAKEVNERHLEDHGRNAHPLFVYARLVHELVPIQPEGTRAQEAALAERLYLRAIELSPKRQQLFFGLARFYSQIGESQKSYETLKRAVSFNENVGESWWYYGLVAWLELGKEEEGTKALIRAVDASDPFALRNVQDALYLARAALVQEDDETLRSVIPLLPKLSGGSVPLFLDIARVMEQAGLIEERNSILNALLQIDETLAPKLEALRTGEVDTIDESIRRAPDVQSLELSTTTESEPSEPEEEESVSSGPGPRL